ncbi:MAG: hypothetical protein IJ860_01895 [Eubacterium sp.]|nr:hypothetical protein [Eubacterium sp.]
MKKCAVKFCGGCNPRYDRGAAYRRIKEETSGAAEFEIARQDEHYDTLLIIRGCTQCPYLYEEIHADRRIICTSEDEVQDAIVSIGQRN